VDEARQCGNKGPPHVPYASISHIMTVYCIIVSFEGLLVVLFYLYSSTATLGGLWSAILLFEPNCTFEL